MAEIIIDKEAGHVVLIEDSKRQSRSIQYEDTVISVPPDGFKKVHNIYVDPATGRLIISYEE